MFFLQIEDLQNQIKEAERKVDEKRSILETSQVLECEQDDAEKISLIEQICMFVFFPFPVIMSIVKSSESGAGTSWVDIHSDNW